MIDPTSTTATEFENRLPAAYSQGFAHIRVLTTIDPDSTGPLGGGDLPDIAFAAEGPMESGPKTPLDDLLRAD